VTQTGYYLDEFFRMYASNQAKPNVLSLAEVEDMYTITYVPGQAFIYTCQEETQRLSI
jgi:hypothetical protein